MAITSHAMQDLEAMRQGRWSSRLPARYVHNESASAALAYLC